MLRFGYAQTLETFEEVVDQLPMRLLVSLGNAAEIYFDEDAIRSIQTITGLRKTINHNKQLALYSCEERQQMVDAVYAVYKHAMLKRFQTTETESKSIYIAPELFDIPINVGDRSSTIQDTSCALMGITLLLAIIIVIKSKASTYLQLQVQASLEKDAMNTHMIGFFYIRWPIINENALRSLEVIAI